MPKSNAQHAVKPPITAKQFLDGLASMRREELRRKYRIPRDIDLDLLVAVLAFMQKEESTRGRHKPVFMPRVVKQ